MKGISLQDRPSLPTPQNGLLTPIQYVKGVGPSKAEVLAKVDIRTIEDLIFYFPRDHQDRRVMSLKDAVQNSKHAFLVEIKSIQFLRSGKMLGQARAQVSDGKSVIDAVWFKRLSFKYDVFSALKRDIVPGCKVLLYGAIQVGKMGVELHVEDHDVYVDGLDLNRIIPVYPLTEGLNDRWLRNLISRILPTYVDLIVDPLPGNVRVHQSLLELPKAIQQYHFPKNWAERDKARERLAFDEFFLLELALAINRQDRTHRSKGFACVIKKNLLTPFRTQLGYEFTRAQSRVINEIFRDMQRSVPMNRLLQGDVGSGKTVVALSAALLSIENGQQVAFLAPTEILANQHAISIQRLFKNLPVRTAVLTGSMSSSERKKVLDDLSKGYIHLLIGTHAILNQDVQFNQLGLVIIDEQHRFGVRQRAKLVTKSGEPDVLIMTATPIPRTLALTIYGDLDVSVLDEMPIGRTEIKTSFSFEADAWRQIESEIKEGRQAYVVFPLVEESELLKKKTGKTIQAATREYEKIKARFPDHGIALLHGQMVSQDKSMIMEKFRSNEVSILVATPVIEVGIDVPNATIIAIVNPERFGLAQLHQLRGRVGRGRFASQCLLVVDPLEERMPGDRLSVFCAIRDGFRLAEEDLKLRGPGEFLGEAQHGLPFFKVGNLLKDGLLISRSREAARALVEGEIPLVLKEFGMLNRVLHKKFGTKLNLSSVG